jgi:hypothetical protein
MRRAYYILDNSPDINSAKFVVVFADGAANVRTIDDPSTQNPLISDGEGYYVATDSPSPAPALATASGYASYLGGFMKDSNQKTYFIAVKDAVTQLETIAVASGSDIVPGSTRHYYLPVPPNTLITVTISAADRVKNNVQYMEYADALQFAAASFIEIFPKGVKVLSVGAPYNDDFTIIQIPSGPDKGKYQVSGDIQGLVLKIKRMHLEIA